MCRLCWARLSFSDFLYPDLYHFRPFCGARGAYIRFKQPRSQLANDLGIRTFATPLGPPTCARAPVQKLVDGTRELGYTSVLRSAELEHGRHPDRLVALVIH